MFFVVYNSVAQAHEAYTGTQDPVTNAGCCGNKDCAAVPLDADWVQPVQGGFQVTMTVEQAQSVNPESSKSINAVVSWKRVMPIITGSPPALYHICIVANELRCLFIASGT